MAAHQRLGEESGRWRVEGRDAGRQQEVPDAMSRANALRDKGDKDGALLLYRHLLSQYAGYGPQHPVVAEAYGKIGSTVQMDFMPYTCIANSKY